MTQPISAGFSSAAIASGSAKLRGASAPVPAACSGTCGAAVGIGVAVGTGVAVGSGVAVGAGVAVGSGSSPPHAARATSATNVMVAMIKVSLDAICRSLLVDSSMPTDVMLHPVFAR